MSFKNSKVLAILRMKCPRCQEGDLFPAGTLLHPARFSEMNKSCAKCGQDFEPGLGFYYGAMYASFGFNTLIFIAVWVGMALTLEEVMIGTMVIVLAVVSVALLPLNFRLSRALWINIFVDYEGPAADIPRKKDYTQEMPAKPAALPGRGKIVPKTA